MDVAAQGLTPRVPWTCMAFCNPMESRVRESAKAMQLCVRSDLVPGFPVPRTGSQSVLGDKLRERLQEITPRLLHFAHKTTWVMRGREMLAQESLHSLVETRPIHAHIGCHEGLPSAPLPEEVGQCAPVEATTDSHECFYEIPGNAGRSELPPSVLSELGREATGEFGIEGA